MKIQVANPPAPSSRASLPKATPVEERIVDRLLPGPKTAPALLRAAARSTVATQACGATLGAALAGGAALAQQASSLGLVTGGVVGALVGAGLGHVLARYGQIRMQRVAESEKVDDFARQTLRSSGMADGLVQRFGSALVITKGNDLLVHFRNSGDLLLAQGLGDKESVVYAPESEARPGTATADFLLSHNRKIPHTSYQLYGPAGEKLQGGSGKNLKIELSSDGQLSFTNVHYSGDSTTVYDLANSTVQHPRVTIEKGVVTRLNGHDPGLSLPSYQGHGVFSLGGGSSSSLPLEPEVFGPVGCRTRLEGEGPGRLAAAAMARAGLESCASQDLQYSGYLDKVAPAHVDEIYNQTKDQDVRALIEFARQTCKAGEDVGAVMKGVLQGLSQLTEQTSRLELFKRCGQAAGGDRVAAAFLTRVKNLSDSPRDRKLIDAVLAAPTGVKDNLDRSRDALARTAVYRSTWEILEQKDLSLTQALSRAGLAIAASSFSSGTPPHPADLRPVTDYFLKAIQAEVAKDSPQSRLIQLSTTCGGNPYRGDELQGLAGFGALRALESSLTRPAELFATAATAALSRDRSYGTYGRSTHADWKPYLQPLLQEVKADLGDNPALQAQVDPNTTYKAGEILEAVLQ